MSISEAESGLTSQQYTDIQAEYGDLAVDVVLQRYGPAWTQHDTEAARSGDNFDAVVAGAYLLRAYVGGISDITVERLADESGGDEVWANIACPLNDVDTSVPVSLVASGLTARVFYYTAGGVIKYTECADISSGTFGAAQTVGVVSSVVFLAAVSTTRVHYITHNTSDNYVLHVYEDTGSWVNTDSDIYWPYSIEAFDAVAFETGRDLLTLATDLPPLIGSRVIGAEVTQEVNQVQGIVTFWVANGRWSDHSKIDVIDRVDTDPSRASLRQTLNNSLLFTAYLRCGGTEAYPYSKAAVARSADGQNWEFPELIEDLTPPYAILARSDYLYAVGVDKVLRSPCCAWAGQTPVEYSLTEYILGLESTAADIRSSQVTVSNPADALATTLAKSNDRIQAKYKLGYVVGGTSLLMQVSLEDVVERAAQAALPKLGLALTTRDFLGRVNRVRSDYAAEWPNMQAGRDTYNDPSETGYGGLRHTAPYEGSWKTPGSEEIHLLSKNREGLAVSTLVTGALNGSAETAFQVNTAGNSEYGGIAFRVFDKDNLHYFIYNQDTDKLKLISGIGTDDDDDDERDNTTLATSNSTMGWYVDTWYWLKVTVRYSLVYAFYSTDGITWAAVTWAGGGGTNPIELAGVADDELAGDLVLSGRFGLIGYGYSANDSWPPYTPPPWVPPVLPGYEGPVKACVAWTYNQIGYTPDLLLHHCAGTATAGTAGVALHDSDADFVALGVAVGDAIERIGSVHPNATTTVAAIVSATQLTLVADIGLSPTGEYHVCGAQWTDIKGTISGNILHFISIRTGTNTVGAWVLTDTGAYYTSNVLTPSPTWSLKLTISQVRTATGDTSATGAAFRCIHGYAAEPGYAIISIDHGQQGITPWGFPNYAAYTGGYVHTHDYGGGWTYASIPAGAPLTGRNRDTCYSGLEVCEGSGKIFGIRPWGTGASYFYYSDDLGGTFNYYAEDQGVLDGGHHQEIYTPFSTGGAVYYMDRGRVDSYHKKSHNGGINWNNMAAAGYSVGDGGKQGVSGWKSDANDVLMQWKRDADGIYCLLRSGDAGGAWSEIGDTVAVFGAGFGTYYGTVAIISSTWPGDEDVVFWVGLQANSAQQGRRICYTQDNGVSWLSKMGNWLTVFGSWSGALPVTPVDHYIADVGCCPLPRVGSNK